MEDIFNFILAQSDYAHFYIFGLFMLAGFNVPVSEDVLIIAGAIISVKFAPENATLLFLSCYLGAYFSDLICYFLGRTLGLRIISIKPFSKFVDQNKINSMSGFFEKFGIATLFFGRFIPFGVRNALFLSAGISKMNFVKFAVVDLLACTTTSVILFSLGRLFAENYEKLFEHLANSKWIIVAIALMTLATIVFFKKRKGLKSS